jgi:uncharacterized phage protein gp47/JayE
MPGTLSEGSASREDLDASLRFSSLSFLVDVIPGHSDHSINGNIANEKHNVLLKKDRDPRVRP